MLVGELGEEKSAGASGGPWGEEGSRCALPLLWLGTFLPLKPTALHPAPCAGGRGGDLGLSRF